MSKAWQDISPQAVEAKLEQKEAVQFIDVRNPDEYSEGHIEGAILIPLPVLPVRLHEIDPEKEVIFICRSGARSSQACEYVTGQGYKKVANMTGGMLNWQGMQETKQEGLA
ncbi:rhodanese-like domain-containing protein [Brevibacillus sp. NRS-1366]|uniref:rhodanese-like domain-containing protein n=1 Tax=Brevibacillus sp. NRS-1366 TaxID=3233899 RepID=UPI003D254F0D